MPFNIVLVQPEIPNNTGNIGRLCLAVGAKLHLVRPFGFELSNARLKRAGLDYWKHISVTEYKNIDAFFAQHQAANFAFLSSHASKSYVEIPFQEETFLVFGKESKGLGEELIQAHREELYKIPLLSNKIRSLNIANAVSIVAYEGLRQVQV